MKLTLLLIPLILLSSCTIDWNGAKDKKIAELEKQVTKIPTVKVPEYSFKTHIIQFGGIHSKIYDGVYWEVTRENDSPQSDSIISDLHKGLVTIDYRGRKDFFTITCPTGFKIEKCGINGSDAIYNENTCSFYFPEDNTNSNITFNCINDKFLPAF